MRIAGFLIVLSLVSGCYGDKSLGEGTDSSVVSSSELRRELMDRWNETVDASAPSLYDFHWERFEQFPHPTYAAGGELDGYRDFARILLDFLDDNFDYLAGHHLFDARLSYDMVSGDSDGWSLRGLVNELTSDWYGPDQTTLDELAQMAERIDETN